MLDVVIATSGVVSGMSGVVLESSVVVFTTADVVIATSGVIIVMSGVVIAKPQSACPAHEAMFSTKNMMIVDTFDITYLLLLIHYCKTKWFR
jgi:hypothetical protein